MRVRALTETDAEAIAGWRYPGRFATYDVGEVVDPGRGFWAVADAGALVGYCCFGAEALVPGAEQESGLLDVGYGMRPDLVGTGLGRAFVGAVLEFARGRFSEPRFRLLILDWNRRSLRVAEALGFEREGVIASDEGDFVAMTRTAGPSPES